MKIIFISGEKITTFVKKIMTIRILYPNSPFLRLSA